MVNDLSKGQALKMNNHNHPSNRQKGSPQDIHPMSIHPMSNHLMSNHLMSNHPKHILLKSMHHTDMMFVQQDQIAR